MRAVFFFLLFASCCSVEQSVSTDYLYQEYYRAIVVNKTGDDIYMTCGFDFGDLMILGVCASGDTTELKIPDRAILFNTTWFFASPDLYLTDLFMAGDGNRFYYQSFTGMEFGATVTLTISPEDKAVEL